MATLGMTTGAHRLWAHRSYKASTGLRITLMIFQTLAGVVSIFLSCIEHNVIYFKCLWRK